MFYSWMDTVLTRVYHPIRAHLNRACQSDEDIFRKKHVVEQKSLVIQKTCEAFVKGFIEKHKSVVDQLSSQLLRHLKCKTASDAMMIWRSDDLPVEEYGDTWPIIQQKIDELIDNRIGSIIRDWERHHRHMQTQQKDLLHFIGLNTRAISDQLEDLEKLIRSTSLTDADTETASRRFIKASSQLLAQVGSLDIPPQLEDAEFFKDMKMLISENFSITSPQQGMLMQNLIDVVTPAFLIDLRKMRRQKMANKMHDLYRQNKMKFMTDKAMSILGSIQRREVTRQLIETQLEGLVDYVKDVKHKTPTVLEANNELMRGFVKDTRTSGVVTRIYQPLETEISELLNRSASFAYQAIKEYGMHGRNILKRKDSGYQQSIRHRKSHKVELDGLFGVYEIGQLKKDQQTVVTIKNYTRRMCDADKLHEERSVCDIIVFRMFAGPFCVCFLDRHSLELGCAEETSAMIVIILYCVV